MKGIRFNLMVLGCASTLILSCGPSEEYVRNQQMVAANQTEAQAMYDRFRAEANSNKLADLEKVAKGLSDAGRLDPNNQAITSLKVIVDEKIASLKGQLKDLSKQADIDMQLEDWEAAIEKLQQIKSLDANYEDTESRLVKAGQAATKALYQKGKTLAKQEDWKQAAQAYKRLLEINPDYFDVAKLYEEAKSRDNAQYYITEAENAGRGQNWDRSILLYEKAAEYEFDNNDLRNKIDALKAKVGQIYFSEAIKLTNQGSLYKALAKLENAKSYSSSLPDDAAYKDFVAILSSKMIERADGYADKELWGNAYIWLQKAEQMNPNYPNIFEKKLEARDRINKRIKKSIAVFDFGSPGNSKDAGKIAANKLIVYLYKKASGDLRIIERENLQSILREMQLGQTGLVDINAAKNVGKMQGIDTLIMGDVLQYSTEYKDIPSVAQAMVKISGDEIPNPAYSDWIRNNQRATPEQYALAPPQMITSPSKTEFIPYKVGSAKITAMIEISYKLVDTSTGENIFTNTIPGKEVKEDKYQDGVPLANIPHDPLELPSELEVLDELTNQKVSDVGESVLKKYQSLEVEYYNQARQQEKRRDYDQAVEKYMNAIFDEKLKGVATVISQKSEEGIDILIRDK